MKIEYDKEADALYVEFSKSKIYKTREESDNFLVDVDKKGNVVGIEVLNASKIAPKKKLSVSIGERKISIPAY